MAIRALRLGKVVGDRSQPVASIWADTPRPGTPANDAITGTPGNDTLFGDGGDDMLFGVGGDDNLNGGDGHDRLEGGDGADGLDGGDGNDTLIGGAGGDGLYGGNGNDTLLGGNAGNDLYGGPGDTIDGLYGGAGDDILDGGGGGDYMVGGTGNDTYYVDKILSLGGDRVIPAPPIPGDEIVELAGEGFDIVYVGLAAYDRTYQFGVDDYALGDNEIEVLAARYPESTRIMRFVGNDFPNAIYGASNGGGPFGDQLFGRGGDDVLHGLGGPDQLYGDEGNDVIVGGTGNDTMRGGTGNDIYYADSPGDLIFEAAGQGLDRVAASTSLFLLADQEIEILDAVNLTSTNAMNLAGTNSANIVSGNNGVNELYGRDGNDLLNGAGGDDYLEGGAGDDILDGGGGRGGDLMVGGTGNDTYYVDKILSYSDNFVDFTTYPGDEIVELAGEGFDTLYVGLTRYDHTYDFGVDHYSLGANDEIEVLAARDPASTRIMRFGGNDFPNAIYGASADDGFGDVLQGWGGDDALYGLAGNDDLYGGEGNDVIVGGTGNDKMYGNSGDDIYYSDSPGDLIFEVAGEGLDRVAASTSLFLLADQEIEILDAVNLTSTNAMNLGGTNSANIISGNNGVNQLYGRDGNDVLNGAGGDDLLEGGGGNDNMTGGLGNDTYYVDGAGDAVNELAGEGNDRVAAGASFALSANASIETLEAATPTGTAALDFTGSEIGQTISGNDGANTLRGMAGSDILFGLAGNDTLIGGEGNDVLVGGAGADVMTGGAGNDTYYVDDSGDTVTEAAGEGGDRVATSISFTLAAGVEVETLEAVNLASDQAMDLTGNEFDNVIIGNNGANRIDGREGNDVLTGAAGADLFAFTTALGANNIDQITRFVPDLDRILLDDAVFTGLTPGALPPGAYRAGIAAVDADDRIIYNSNTGALLFDVDGVGGTAAIQFATIGLGRQSIDSLDFLVI